MINHYILKNDSDQKTVYHTYTFSYPIQYSFKFFFRGMTYYENIIKMKTCMNSYP